MRLEENRKKNSMWIEHVGGNGLKLSIIVPIYNAERYLNECIESIINQTFDDFELILVNDGSKDNSLSICSRWKKKDKRIKVIDKKNGGVSSARNEGIKIACGEYLGFVDSDDYIDECMYEKLVKLVESVNADIGICKRVIPGKKQNYGHDYPIQESFTFKNNNGNWKTMFYQGDIETFVTNKLFKASFLKESKVEFKEYSLFEDRLYLIQLYLYNPKMIYVDEELYYYRPVKGSSVHRYCAKRFLIIKEIYKHELELNTKYENEKYLQVINKCFAESVLNCIIQEKKRKKNQQKEMLEIFRKSEEFQDIYFKIDTLNLKSKKKRMFYLLFHQKYFVLFLWLKMIFAGEVFKTYLKIIVRGETVRKLR